MKVRLAAVAALFLVLAGCGKPISRNVFLLDTVVSVTLYRGGSEEVLDGVLELCRDYERVFSRTIETSEVYRLNHAGGEPVTVCDDMQTVIACAVACSERTMGRYDITISPVVELWDFTSGESILPDDREIAGALQSVGSDNIRLSGNTVQLLGGARIDLGSIAKGYIADRMAEYLTEHGVKGAIINLGGNIKTVGEKDRGEPFHIGIQKPFSDRDETIGYVNISGQRSVVSSGIYERSFERGGRLYHHILDPETGYPAETGLVSVTVISDSSMEGDALSTSLFLLGLDRGLLLAEATPGIEAVFITEDGGEHFTSGIEGELAFERTQ